MNGTYYPNPTFPSNMNNFTPDQEVSTNTMPMEQSYIENILRLNKGKKAKVFCSFPDSNEWKRSFSYVFSRKRRLVSYSNDICKLG